jgi:hypothetical protein
VSDIGVAIGDRRRIALWAGSEPHRFTSLWVVVVDGRVFVRSWSLKPGGWYRTLLREPHGFVRVGELEIAFRAAHTRSERIRAAVDRAYRERYGRPGELRYVRDMCGARSRATTTELRPVARRSARRRAP